MGITTGSVLYWSPRVLCLLFAGFLSLFALDIFAEHLGFWGALGAFTVHLIPTWIILGSLAIAWRWELAGSFVIVGLGLFYLFSTWGRFHWSAHMVIAGPAFLVGILFLAHWLLSRRAGTVIEGSSAYSVQVNTAVRQVVKDDVGVPFSGNSRD